MKLSIITINYNNCEGLRKTIDSVISQTWQDFEWIIVDGGSTDGSRELIEQTAALLEAQGWPTEQFSGPEDPAAYIADQLLVKNSSSSHRLLWCSERDKGVYNAMNKGILYARGEYLNFMNSGDTFYNTDVLSNIWKREHDADVIFGTWIWSSPNKEIPASYDQKPNIGTFYMCNICHQAMFVRSAILKEEGYDETFKLYSDWARWMKLANEGGSFESLPYCICRFELGGLSSRDALLAKKELDVIRRIPSPSLRSLLESFSDNRNRLRVYDDCYLTKQTLLLAQERPLYSRLLHMSIILVRSIKCIVDQFNNMFK